MKLIKNVSNGKQFIVTSPCEFTQTYCRESSNNGVGIDLIFLDNFVNYFSI